MSNVKNTEYYSKVLGSMALGCRYCVKGCKLVVFVTGLCPRNCFYCPLSEFKKNRDVIFANERKLKNENDTNALIEEAIACRSQGAGFTGGDPLVKIKRTVRYIKLLKRKFENKFHIHLYTSLDLIDNKKLKMLDSAGLDELRFHPDLISDKLWDKIKLCSGYKFKIGVEIPLIPGYEKQTKKLVDYFIKKTGFINLNELEISDTNACKLVDKKFRTKNRLSYGVKGSEEMGIRILKFIDKKYPNKNIHYCTCKLKDAVQLRNRLILRAKNTKKIFDILTEDGTFVRGVIYLEKPSFGYKKKLEEMSNEEKKKIISKLKNIKNRLIKEYKIPNKFIEVDELKPRIITNIGIIDKLKKDLKAMNLIPAIVEQYPTYDQMEVDVQFL